jgi:hypothetical protein
MQGMPKRLALSVLETPDVPHRSLSFIPTKIDLENMDHEPIIGKRTSK